MLGAGLRLSGGGAAKFTPLKLSPQLWLDATDQSTLNTKTAADFVAANTEYLSSSSTDFDKGNESFSFGGWFKPDSVGGGTAKYYMGKMSTTSGNWSYVFFETTTGLLSCGMSNDGSAFYQKNTTYSPTTDWQFFVMVYDADADLQKISVNAGAFTTMANSVGAYAGSTADLTINGTTTGGNLFDGSADSCFFYNKALTEAQITGLYNSGNGKNYSDLTSDELISLVSYWGMKEQSGTRLDSHGSNDLTDNNTVGYSFGKVQEPATNGEYIYLWVDKSGNGFNVTQATGANQPTWNSSGYLIFDGVNDKLVNASMTTTQPITIFIVLKDRVGGATQANFYDSNTGSVTAFQRISSTFTLNNGGSLSGGAIDTNLNLFCLKVNSISSQIIKNGTSVATGNSGTNNFNGITLGATRDSLGFSAPIDLYEFIIYNGILTNEQITNVTNYLNDKHTIY